MLSDFFHASQELEWPRAAPNECLESPVGTSWALTGMAYFLVPEFNRWMGR